LKLAQNPKDIQVLLLPGLGGDHRMVYRQLALPYSVVSSDYIPMHEGESLHDYTLRFGEYLVGSKVIYIDRPLFLGGYSFGSAIAQELSLLYPALGIIIIGGLFHHTEMKPLIHFFGQHIAGHLPRWVYRATEPLVPVVMRRVSQIPPQDIELSRVMYHDLPQDFFRRGYEALARWEGCNIHLPLLRMHGANDQILSCPTSNKDVVIIPNAKHLIGQSQPLRVNESVEQFVERVLRKDT